MPSPKAFLRDIADFNLDPKVAHTKSSLGSDGRMKQNRGLVESHVECVAVEPTKVETAIVDTGAPVVTKPPAPVHSGRKQKKATNAHDSVESNVHSDKQEASEESEPTKVSKLDTVEDV